MSSSALHNADTLVQATLAPMLEAIVEAVASRVAEKLSAQTSSRTTCTPLVDKREMARLLGVSTQTIDRLDREGQPFFKVGDGKRYDPSVVLEWHRDRTPSAPREVVAPEKPVSGVRRLSKLA